MNGSKLPNKFVLWYRPSILIRRSGRGVDVIKTQRPGYVLYEDDFQIAAEPFKDAPTRARRSGGAWRFWGNSYGSE